MKGMNDPEFADKLMELADFIERQFDVLGDYSIVTPFDGAQFAVDAIRSEAYHYDPQSWNRYPEKEN